MEENIDEKELEIKNLKELTQARTDEQVNEVWEHELPENTINVLMKTSQLLINQLSSFKFPLDKFKHDNAIQA